eukprot:13172201-Alexandrium_andersonii.AAC.1
MKYFKMSRGRDEVAFRKLILDTEVACGNRTRGIQRKGVEWGVPAQALPHEDRLREDQGEVDGLHRLQLLPH